jgi:hypothetical protein
VVTTGKLLADYGSLSSFSINSSRFLAMFTPSHLLVTRSKKTPVQLIPSEQGFKILTEIEYDRGTEPIFEMRNKLGFFCQGIAVIGYTLEPIDTPTPEKTPSLAQSQA